MKVAIFLLAILGTSVALPAQNVSWNEIKGVNLIVKPVSNNYTVDEPNVRIIGGDEAIAHSRPYQVALIVDGEKFCTGSLISPDYVLTSAQCVATASYVTLIFGAHNVNADESSQLRVRSTNIITHPDYNRPYNYNNNIALIKTPYHIVTNNYIQIISLATPAFGLLEGLSTALTGWGSTSDSSTGISPILRIVFLVVMNNIDCLSTFGRTYDYYGNFCTHGRGGVGGCTGDSGAPLVYGRHQIGVLSFISSAGCESHQPTVFTRVSHHRHWINQVAGL